MSKKVIINDLHGFFPSGNGGRLRVGLGNSSSRPTVNSQLDLGRDLPPGSQLNFGRIFDIFCKWKMH